MTTKRTPSPKRGSQPENPSATAEQPKPAEAPADAPQSPKGRKGRLTDQQRTFCEHLNRGMTAAEAARRAGYSKSYADREANQLLEKPQVKAYMDELRAASRTDSIADGKERREFLSRVLRGEVKDVATGGKELEYIETPVPVAERTRAAVELAKMDGDYAPVKLDVKVTEYSRDWLKQTLAVIARYVSPEDLRKIAGEIPRFDP